MELIGLYNRNGINNYDFVIDILKHFNSVYSIRVKIDDCQCDYSFRYNINRFPTFVLLKNNMFLDSLTGKHSLDIYEDWFSNHYLVS